MAAYFHGGSEILSGNDHYHHHRMHRNTLDFMNPTTSLFACSDHDPGVSTTRLFEPHPPPEHQQLYGSWSHLAAARGHNSGEIFTLASAMVIQSGVVSRSVYLNPVRELLDAVVNIGKKRNAETTTKTTGFGIFDKKKKVSVKGGVDGGNNKHISGVIFSQMQRQELQRKRARLLNMIEQVERRYRHYTQQMKTVVVNFEEEVGFGSAESYTALTLQTISTRFRCLKDSIVSQIKIVDKTLGEDEEEEAIPRLSFLDRYKMKQQSGMTRHHDTWRPQRGLPKHAVSLLRTWLFDHFLHPYPRDSDKLILVRQTGLTRNQVSNWFINARVRLWKPMVEAMYIEEMMQAAKATEEKKNSVNEELGEPSCVLSEKRRMNFPDQSSPKKQRSNTIITDVQNSPSSVISVDMEMLKEQRQETNNQGFGGFEVQRFDLEHLTAPEGLIHGSNRISLSLSLSENQQTFLPYQNFDSPVQFYPAQNLDFSRVRGSQTSHSGIAAYQNVDVPGRKRFPSQVMPHFWA